ncbi:unnamed protein product [Caenorhabditis angaria]|uniref:Uncharacterized protein n=1 Tax=Caenorhabditis angaria TaxID=860376 RepID=A0A9P1IEW7_9PELO|nr:unnamed protein product [Caenorhabditis angaria]
MGELAPEVPQPKPSRFQFVPVPGEFTRGRWKCRDSVKPYAELLEFDKSGKEDKPNPNKITVTRKFVQEIPSSDTILVTSIEDNTNKEEYLVTRKKGVTIVRKGSNSVSPEKDPQFSMINNLSIDDFEKVQQQRNNNMVPPTPMNTPPATMSDSMLGSKSLAPQDASTSSAKPKVFQVQAVIDSQPTRKFSHENGALQRIPDASQFQNLDNPAYSATLPPQKPRVFHVQPVQDLSMRKERAESVVSCAHFTIQSNNDRDIDGVFNVCPPKRRESEENDDIEIRTVRSEEESEGVSITISSMIDKRMDHLNMDDTEIIASKREVASSVSSLDAAGIPIASSTPIAPHSTPYGTPKDFPRSPIEPPSFTSTSINPPSSVVSAPNLASSTPVTVTESNMMPIDNKIEQAMELVKTHLTYAVREEVDTLKNTITDLEYQMREFQYECNFLRQHVSQEVMEQAATYVRQQMQKFQPPTRRSMSLAGCTSDVSSTNINNTGNSSSSTHMRNLQNQIQQIKVSHPPPTLPNS